MFGLPWHEPRVYRIRFRIERAAQYVRERIWSVRQKIVELPECSVILEMTSCSEPEVIAWVRSFGEDAELLTEQEMRYSSGAEKPGDFKEDSRENDRPTAQV